MKKISFPAEIRIFTTLLPLLLFEVTLMMTACSSNDDVLDSATTGAGKITRTDAQAKTVLVYMAGRNSLSNIVDVDLNEMKRGSKYLVNDDNLLVFVRRYDKTEQPWLARIKDGEVIDTVSLDGMGIRSSDGQDCASDPAVMEGVMRYAFNHYPAKNGYYGLVLWGHGSGWLMMDEVEPNRSRAFGLDDGSNANSQDERWINIPTLANILKGMPHLKYIMCDCCNMMCLENLYELRTVCDYVIGSPAEIPGQGAPYDQIVPDLFGDGHFYSRLIDKYYASVNGNLPLTAVQTSEMEHVAQATRQALQAMDPAGGFDAGAYPDMTGLIHYYHTDARTYTDAAVSFFPEYNIFYDAGDFFLKHAPQEVYRQWKQALDKAIVERRNATTWETDKVWQHKYADFTVTDKKMHGVSIFVPQDPAKGNYAKYNEDIRQMEWYKAVTFI